MQGIKKYSLIIAMFCSLTVLAENKINFKRNYTGILGRNLKVSFQIKNNNGQITGFYFYQKIGVDIKIVGELKGQVLNVYELDHNNDTTAVIKATVCDSIINGEWINAKSKKRYPLKLTETSHEIIPLPEQIEGQYKSNGCNLTLIISQVKGIYSYRFISKIRSLKGNISFSRGSENYMILEGIEFAEDYFDVALPDDSELSAHYEEMKKEGVRRVGIDCFLDEEQIIIQNYGNAMNYYVKLRDCGEKYIHLMKE